MDGQGFMPSEAVLAGIRADVARYEAGRVQAHRAVRWRVPAFLAATVAFVVAVAYVLNGLADPFEQWTSAPHVFVYVGSAIAAFFIYGWAMRPATKLQQSFRERLLPIAFSFIDGVKYRTGWVPESFARLPRETVGSFNRQGFDDFVSGQYAGFPFELYEASLSQKAGKTTTSVFKGVIVAFKTERPFPGVLVAARRSGVVTKFFRDFFGGRLEELKTGVPELDETYDFRTSNAEAAQPLVAGRLPKALLWLAQAWPEQPARVALHDDDGYLLIPTARNFFEMPGISVPLDYDLHVKPMVADMASLLATVALVRKINEDDVAVDPAAAEPQP